MIAGSRESRLARWQTEHVMSEIQRVHGSESPQVEMKLFKTTGDRILEKPLAEVGGKSLFTKELDEALLRGDIDFAVHSLKDVPTEVPDGLTVAAILSRTHYYDAVVLPASAPTPPSSTTAEEIFAGLPAGAVVGTSSPRRVAQLRRRYPHLEYRSVRGNLDTRLAKLDRGEYAVLVLAEAGLRRLALGQRIAAVLGPPLCLPAVGQGALAVECRSGDTATLRCLQALGCADTTVCTTAERAFLNRLEGGCSVPVGVHTQLLEDGRLSMSAIVLSEDASQVAEQTDSDSVDHAAQLGIRMADSILLSHPALIQTLRSARDYREKQSN